MKCSSMDMKTKTVLQSPIAENVHSEGECEQPQIINYYKVQLNSASILTVSVIHPPKCCQDATNASLADLPRSLILLVALTITAAPPQL